MPDTGAISPGTVVEDSSYGVTGWFSYTAVMASDNTYCDSGGDSQPIGSSSVRLVKGGTISGNDNGGATPPGSDAYTTFGGAADKWGLSWTTADVNASDFGCVVSVTTTAAAEWYYIKCTNFGFTVPGGSTIDGIKVEVEWHEEFDGDYRTYVDHIRMTVYYTESGGSGSLVSKSISIPISIAVR